MVIDASVLLAILFREEHGFWAQSQLQKYRDRLRMSTVNLTEVLIHLQNRLISPTISQAETSAWARLKFPALNLGDCFAYALAKEQSSPILTLDSDFKKSDIEVICPAEL